MTQQFDQNLLVSALKFMGRETARQTHEITNVHNILNEMTGLLGDIVSAAAAGREIDPERIQGILQRMQTQIQRGNSIVRGLNRFAHCVDVPFGIFEVRDLAERVAFISERPVRLAKASLRSSDPSDSASIEGFLLGHQQAVLMALELVLESGGRNQEIDLRYETEEAELKVSVECENKPLPGEETRELEEHLITLVTELGGRATCFVQKGEKLSVTLVFPVVNASGD